MQLIESMDRLPEGSAAMVTELLTTGSMRRRLQDIGLIEGTRIECLLRSPAGDPAAYLIRGAVIALRAEDSSRVRVELC
ncbi:MAG TPA: ferrous iron transport protein A [Candidatus Gallacutalibacter pullicola]|uniref:Ferrous iron transport protein A n=1 Tax=Candidatus Gallacutalibacter pullicola TaxID=2840830 RepID=A0A9D1DS13_9FIRM|nr:ferrous iron transport protein A [Candidatus Gallacutalibacter pullicola]